MQELFNAAFSTVNIIPTFLLIVIVFYWITVFVGILDMDFLHFEVDADVHVDADIHVDADLHADTEVHVDSAVDSAISLNSILSFFNLGNVPFMVFMTFFVFPVWALSIIANHYLHNASFLLSLLFLIPIIFISLFITKFLTWPFAKVFRALNTEKDTLDDLVGKVVTVVLPSINERLGQGELNIDGNHYKMMIKAIEGEALAKGQSALLIEHIKDKNYYLAESYDNH